MALICPVCKQTMVTVQVGTVEIDVCKLGCKGMWFDAFELPAVAGHGHIGDLREVFDAALTAAPRMRPPGVLQCPRCVRALRPMRYHDTAVTVDFCGACCGYFLDAGELQEVCAAAAATGGSDTSTSPLPATGTLGIEPEPSVSHSYRLKPRPIESPRYIAPAPLTRNLPLQEKIIDSVFLAFVFYFLPFNRRSNSHHDLGALVRNLMR